MQFPKISLPLFVLTALVLFVGCQKETLHNGVSDDYPIPAKVFENLSFTPKTAYFSTDGAMYAPVEVEQTKQIAGRVDITYIYSVADGEPGFLSPTARSLNTPSNVYFDPSFNGQQDVIYYTTNLTTEDVKSAKGDQSKIAEYFGDSQVVEVAPSNGYARGSGIGGKPTYKSAPVLLRKGKVFGFLLANTGQRGLIYIRTDQHGAWPAPAFPNDTKVDIVMEQTP